MAFAVPSSPKNYNFSCTLCGDCCRGRQSVALNRDDLQLMARNRGFATTADLFSEGLVEARRSDNGHYRPYIRFRTRPIRMCPFLINDISEAGTLRGLCGLHPNDKPLVCHLAPIGRVFDLKDNTEDWHVHEPSPGCPGMGRGPQRSVDADVVPLRARLDRERDFFLFLEAESPRCNSPEDAIVRLFSYPVSNGLS